VEENLKRNISKLIEKAERKLKVAKSLFSESYCEDALSRAYYSIFLATEALLLTKGLSAKTHSGLLSLFSEHFVKTGVIEEQYYRVIVKSKDLRENGDYDAFFEPTFEETEQVINDAKKFLDRIKEILGKSGYL